MKRIGLLMLGGAKRVAMGRMFVAAGKELGLDVELFSYELDPKVAIASIAQIIVGKRWDDPDIIDDLAAAVDRHTISIVVPFVDGAVEIAARLRDMRCDVFAPAPTIDQAAAMFDKAMADKLFRQLDLPVPESFELGPLIDQSRRDHSPSRLLTALPYPLIAKPRRGSASKGIFVAPDADALLTLDNPDDYVFQEYIAIREEFTVDCYVDRGGLITAAVPRSRLEVAGGEVVRTVTVDDAEITALAVETLGATSLKGAVTIQFMRDLRDKRLLLMEINPRLGGGAVCSVHAGANLPKMIILDSLARKIEKAKWIASLEIARYPQEVVFDPRTN